MSRSPLVVGLAGVFVGLTAVLTLVAVVTTSPVALLVAVPLGLTVAMLWYHASGRLAARTRRRARGAAGPRGDGGPRVGGQGRVRGPRDPFGATRGRSGGQAGGPEPGWSEDAQGHRWYVDPRGRRWRVGPDGEPVGGGGGQAGAGSRPGSAGPGGPDLSRREAYARLDLEPGADEAAVRAAYRDLVKEHHPDAEDGDEEAFKRVTAAYERLVE